MRDVFPDQESGGSPSLVEALEQSICQTISRGFLLLACEVACRRCRLSKACSPSGVFVFCIVRAFRNLFARVRVFFAW